MAIGPGELELHISDLGIAEALTQPYRQRIVIRLHNIIELGHECERLTYLVGRLVLHDSRIQIEQPRITTYRERIGVLERCESVRIRADIRYLERHVFHQFSLDAQVVLVDVGSLEMWVHIKKPTSPHRRETGVRKIDIVIRRLRWERIGRSVSSEW